MTDPDTENAWLGEELWKLVEMAPGQQPEFGIVAVAYIDREGEQRFSWRVASVTEGVDVEPVVQLLTRLIESVEANIESTPLDPFE